MGNGDVSQTQAGFNWSLHDPKSGHPDGIQQLTRREWMRRDAFLSDKTLLGPRRCETVDAGVRVLRRFASLSCIDRRAGPGSR